MYQELWRLSNVMLSLIRFYHVVQNVYVPILNLNLKRKKENLLSLKKYLKKYFFWHFYRLQLFMYVFMMSDTTKYLLQNLNLWIQNASLKI